jgi:hypothetical protein
MANIAHVNYVADLSKDSEYDSHDYLTNIVDYEFKALSPFVNLGTIKHQKSNMKYRIDSTLRLMYHKVGDMIHVNYLTDLLNYEFKTLS